MTNGFEALFNGQYQGRRVLLTGHTGFKGSWLALWLQQLNAEVIGLALPPETTPNHWDLLQLNIQEYRQDITNFEHVANIIVNAKPEIVFHLAAQPLVRRAYRQPVETWQTNVMGTVHLLEACRHVESVKAIVVVTTDKCYENCEWPWGYRETDRLGGHDPYSASKAATELVANSYRHAFLQQTDTLLATARAGNVIGGGDWSEERLIPDIVRAIAAGNTVEIRSPQATRPWQHVLESLSGYLVLGQHLLEGRIQAAESWNFGPESHSNRSVVQILAMMQQHWPELVWQISNTASNLHEANLLYLDSAKAKAYLNWQPIWNIQQTLQATADWYRQYHKQKILLSSQQLQQYIVAAKEASVLWAS